MAGGRRTRERISFKDSLEGKFGHDLGSTGRILGNFEALYKMPQSSLANAVVWDVYKNAT